MKISVIVPVYKVENTLKRCVDSILNQTYTDFELILVDDGSPDNSGKMCEAFAENDSRIKVIHKENGGLSSARNAGLDIAQGEYVCFVDSDDYVAENYLALLHSAAEREQADLVIGGYEMVYPDGTCEKEFQPSKLYEGKEAAYALCRELDTGVYVVAWNKLYRKKLWEKERYPVGRVYEDMSMAHRILWLSKRTVIIEDIIYYYVQNPLGITHNKDEKVYLDLLKAMQDRTDFFSKEKEFELVQGCGEWLCACTLFNFLCLDETYRLPVLRKRATKVFRKNFHYILKSNYSFKEKKYFALYFISPQIERLLIKVRSMKKGK